MTEITRRKITRQKVHCMFHELEDGALFMHGKRLWIKVTESDDYNATSFYRDNLTCDFGLSTVVERR